MPKNEMDMKTDEEKANEVDEYVLKATRLVKGKRGYNALLDLLQTGVLFYTRLGMDDTVVLCKMLNFLTFEYEFFSDGIKLKHNSKLNFYHKVMYAPKQVLSYEVNKRNLSVGKEERTSTRHWAHDILANKDKSE